MRLSVPSVCQVQMLFEMENMAGILPRQKPTQII